MFEFGQATSNIDQLIKKYKNYNFETSIAEMMIAKVGEAEIEATLVKQGYNAELVKETMLTIKNNAEKTGEIGTTNTLTVATNKLTVAKKALNVAMNTFGRIIVGIAISAFVSKIVELVNAEKELAESTKQATNELNNTEQSIESYVSQYEDLYEALNKAKGNEEETYKIKQQLLELQQKLNEEFGDAYGKINLVADAYSNASDKIREYSAAANEEYYRENAKGIKNAQEEMSKESSYNLGGSTFFNSLSPDEGIGKEIANIVNQFKDSGMYYDSSNGSFVIRLNADPTTAQETINDFMDEIMELQKKYDDNSVEYSLLDGIVNKSSERLNDVKEIIDTYQESAIRGQIHDIEQDGLIDEYNSLTEAVEKYNNAVLESEDPLNDSEVQRTYNNLKLIRDGIKANTEEWGNYELAVNNALDSADTRLFDFANDIKNNQSLQNSANQFQGMSDVEFVSLEGSIDNTALKADFDELIESANEYGLTIEDVSNLLMDLGILQNQVTKTKFTVEPELSFGDTISQLDQFVQKWNAIDEAYANFKNPDEEISFDNLSSLKEELSDIEGIDEYIKSIQESEGNVEATQKAFDNLATALTEQSGILDIVNEENASLIAQYLEENGIVNANALVQSALAKNLEEVAAQKWLAANASIDLSNATASEIQELINEGTYAGVAEGALIRLVAEKIRANSTTITTNGDIKNLQALAVQAGATAAAIQEALSPIDGTYGPPTPDQAQQNLIDLINKYTANYGTGTEVNTPVYAGGSTTEKSSGGKDKDTEKQFDWIETRLERLKEQRDELEKSANSSRIDFLGISQEDLDRAEELFNMQISPGMSNELNELFDIAQRAGVSIGELQQMVQSGVGANNRESYIQQMLNKDRELIETNKLAIAEYKSEYENVAGLVSPEIREKIENGDINIEEYSGKEAENIEKVQDAYDKYSDAVANQRDLENQYYEDTKSYYENRIAYINAQNTAIENSNNLIQVQMDYMKEAGQIVSASSYEQLIKNLDNQISLMERRKKEQETELQDLLNDPEFNMSEDSEDYYELQDAIADTESEIWDLQTAQEEYNNTLLQMPIDNMDILLNMYQSITTEIENWGATLEASGKKLDQNYYQTLINNGMEIIDQYKEQAELVKDVMDEYEEGSDQWNELYDKLVSINSEMSSMVQNLYEWNEALLQIPLDNIADFTENLQQIADAMSETMSEYNTVIDAVVGAIDAEIDAINDEKDAINEAYQDRIDALQDQLDLLEEQNEEKQLQLDLEQAQYELEKLRSQRNIRVIRDGRIQYEADEDAIRDAQEAVDDAEYNIMKDDLEDQIDDLQDELDGINEKYDDQIERLEEIANKWEEIRTNVEQYNKELVAGDYLGEGWKDKVTSGNDQDIYEMFKGMYEELNDQQNAYNEQIENTENISELLTSYIEAYKEGTITYQEAMNGMKDLLSQINNHATALDNLQNVLDFSGVVNDAANNAESILDAIQNSLTQTADEFLKSFEVYNENAGLITEYTTSWEQLTDNVSNIKDILEEVRDNLDDALEDAKDRDDDDDDGGNSHWDDSDADHGPGVQSYDKGISKGLVGSNSNSDRETKMKLLGLRRLDEDEIRAIIHKGEAVFNPEQQDKLLANFETAYNAAMPKINIPSIPEIKPYTASNTIDITMGDINLPDVTDVDGFARAMGNRFGAIFKQELGKGLN